MVGYTTGGKSIANVAIGDLADNGVDACGDGLPDKKIYGDNIAYNNSSITAYAAIVLYPTPSPTDTDYYPIATLDLRPDGSLPLKSTNGTFKVLLNSDSGGFLTIK